MKHDDNDMVEAGRLAADLDQNLAAVVALRDLLVTMHDCGFTRADVDGAVNRWRAGDQAPETIRILSEACELAAQVVARYDEIRRAAALAWQGARLLTQAAEPVRARALAGRAAAAFALAATTPSKAWEHVATDLYRLGYVAAEADVAGRRARVRDALLGKGVEAGDRAEAAAAARFAIEAVRMAVRTVALAVAATGTTLESESRPQDLARAIAVLASRLTDEADALSEDLKATATTAEVEP